MDIELVNCLIFFRYDVQWFPYLAVLIRFKVGAVVAVGDSEGLNPLIVVLSSLDLYCCHLGFGSKIYL